MYMGNVISIDDAMQSVGISLDEKGRIPVNEQFKTSVEK